MPHECNLIMSTLTTPGKTNSQNYTLEEIQHYLSELQYQSTLAYIPTFVYMSIIVFVGFFGNCMVIIVYCSKMTTTSLRLFMVVMAIFDLIINTIVIPCKYCLRSIAMSMFPYAVALLMCANIVYVSIVYFSGK